MLGNCFTEHFRVVYLLAMIVIASLLVCLFMMCCEIPAVENHCYKTNMSQHEARKVKRLSPCVVPKESKH